MVAVAVSAATADTAAQSIEQRPPARKPAVAAPRTTSVRIAVKDREGASLSDVHLVLSGAGTGEFTTGAAGTAVLPIVTDGVYRVRCEREGFLTLEREFTVRGGAWNPIDIVLNPAPPPAPVIRAPEPAPAPAAVPASGPPVTLSIPEFLDRNFIGREPIKESVIACKPLETVRLLQMREPVARHVHDRLDEIIYVVAGEGTIRIGEDATPLRAGSLVVVPNGSGHSFERQGKNPLIVVSTLSGSACEQAKATQ
jgi:mannose-6-phosphate isomerase-like protein (cupin superfamily)